MGEQHTMRATPLAPSRILCSAAPVAAHDHLVFARRSVFCLLFFVAS